MHPLIVGFGDRKAKHIVNLVQVAKRGNTFRYILVENLNSLLLEYYYDDNGKKIGQQRANFCPKCLLNFTTKHRLDQHFKNCMNNKLQIELMPIEYDRARRERREKAYSDEKDEDIIEENSSDREFLNEDLTDNEYLTDMSECESTEDEMENEEEEKLHRKFDMFYAKYPPKLFIFFDFETTVRKNDRVCFKCLQENALRGGRCKCPVSEHSESSTENVMDMKAAVYAYCIVDCNGRLLKEKWGICREGKAGEKMVEDWLNDEPALLRYMSNCVPMKLTELDKIKFREATKCSICEQTFKSDQDGGEDAPIARDHDHMTGTFLGAAHATCNMIKERKQNKIVAVAHNAFNFDVSFIVRALGKHRNRITERPNLLPKNTQRLRAFKFNNFEVVDSLQHLTASLSSLTDSLKQQVPKHPYNILRQSNMALENGVVDEEKIDIMTTKGYFPYEIFDSLETLENMTDFPPQESFYSTLSDSVIINESEYAFACETYQKFAFNNMLEYCIFYCLLDVLCLAESFLAYCKTIYNFCGLHAGHFLGTPSLSFAAFFKMTATKLEYINDRSLYHLIENNLRGGLSYTATKYGKANENTKIFYTDLNAMYSTAMCEPLPHSCFEILKKEDIENIDWFNIEALANNSYGYFLEVDLEFPPNIHEEFSEMPLAAEKMTITYSMLSPYTKCLLQAFRGSHERFEERKLTATYFPRKKLSYTFSKPPILREKRSKTDKNTFRNSICAKSVWERLH